MFFTLSFKLNEILTFKHLSEKWRQMLNRKKDI